MPSSAFPFPNLSTHRFRIVSIPYHICSSHLSASPFHFISMFSSPYHRLSVPFTAFPFQIQSFLFNSSPSHFVSDLCPSLASLLYSFSAHSCTVPFNSIATHIHPFHLISFRIYAHPFLLIA